ncbi:hypothetical protein TIFTF001_026291 [Ficus carica]|uniref:Uncharacterized protein n=1 Tax=Ficus carica TaxID=3494 RepID=A0AA88IXU7_FICCA|nr:hypothetical protein TIFTF001_026291 [Ficus carica]
MEGARTTQSIQSDGSTLSTPLVDEEDYATSPGSSSTQLPQHIQNYLNDLYSNQCNMFENQVMMMDAMRQINPNLTFWPIIRPEPLVPPPPSISEENENEDDDEDEDDTDLGH